MQPASKLADRDVDGLGLAFSTSPSRVRETLAEFKRLNTRDARVAFADHWIGVWGRDFSYAWPVVYELLYIIEQEELYKDPRRVGPGAPGGRDTHGDRPTYASFAEYFTERVRRPLDSWAELEKTYQYAHTYAPDLFELPYDEAREKRSVAAKKIDAKDRENPSRQGQRTDLTRPLTGEPLSALSAGPIGSLFGAPTGEAIGNFVYDTKSNVHEVAESAVPRPAGNSAEAYIRRLRKDRPDIHTRVLAGELTPHGGMVEAGFRKKAPSRKLSALDRIRKLLPELTEAERQQLRELLA